MQVRRNAKDTAFLRKFEAHMERYTKGIPEEVFKWVGGVSAIAALQVVDIRTESRWLQVLPIVLSVLLVARMNAFLYYDLRWTKHREEDRPDGSSVTRFGPVKALVGLVLGCGVWWFAFWLPPIIANSDLLPPVKEEATAMAPQATPQAPSVAPAAVPQASPLVSPRATTAAPSNAVATSGAPTIDGHPAAPSATPPAPPQAPSKAPEKAASEAARKP